MTEPIFFYDFSSPYSYLSANRVDDVLPAPARWQPILFGGLIMAIGKEPWSWHEGPARDARMRECEQRADALGLPLSWPRDWPKGTYSILVLRAALVAEELGRLREFSLAAYRAGLGLGRDLTDLDVVLEVADQAGVDREAVADGVQTAPIKERLREATDAARELGVTGVPTVSVGDELFWGDDRLKDAAAAVAALPGDA
jgi:2-hydroxychromene-2-carboxylate isomerase